MTTYREDFFDYVKSADRSVIPGILVCIAVTLVSFLLTRGTLWDGGISLLPHTLFVDNPVFALLAKIGPIVLALVICLFINYKLFDAGGSYAGKYLLRIAIILMGARVTADVLMSASASGLVIILAVLAVTIVLAMMLGKKFGHNWETSALTGTGNGICGVSATLSVAPVIKADQKYVHAVVGVISLLGIVGVFLVPAIAVGVGMNDAQAEVFIGGTLHEIGNVIPAADLYTAISGGEDVGALSLAYKMIRVAMLVVVASVFGWLWCRRQEMEQASCPADRVKAKVQGFLILFVLMAVGMTAFITASPDLGHALQSSLVNISVTVLTVAMAGVGLSMNLRETLSIGKTLLPFASLIWLIQVVLLLGLTMFLV
ncbi:MAG TPA: putative sulfate exporter family transporter [Methanocorpusculum sp.]|nr:putative sulfate exporter family transporter [Methanocorpusculum sp.]